MEAIRRREFVAAGAAAAGALMLGPAAWRRVFDAQAATVGNGPYGPLLAPDANGIRLPAGFSSRVIAQGGQDVAGYTWHPNSDGQATFRTADGGWILVSNSESWSAQGGGASSISFDSSAQITGARRILGGTERNCAGGPTPWGTWLSCEEYENGQVWECDPTGATTAIVRPAMGVFSHESAAVDPVGKRVYLTEDETDGGFYRFTPLAYPDLSAGLLEVAVVSGDAVTWAPVPDPSALTTVTRGQVADMTRFAGGEGAWFDSGTVYFTTKYDNRVWAYDTQAGTLEIIYDAATLASAPLTGVDNVTVSSFGDVYVCEDVGNLEICLITPVHEVAPFLQVTGAAHSDTELAGAVFDPSGTRLYFASQRAHGSGEIYEISGPFRQPAPPDPPDPPDLPDPPDPPAGAPLAAPSPGATTDPQPDGGDGDRDAPGITAFTRRRIGYRSLRRRGGLPIDVVVDEPGDLRIALTAVGRAARPAARGAVPHPVTVAVGGARRRLRRPGRHKITVKVRAGVLRRLRRRSVLIRVTVQVRTATDEVKIANRRVRVNL